MVSLIKLFGYHEKSVPFAVISTEEPLHIIFCELSTIEKSLLSIALAVTEILFSPGQTPA